MPWTAMISSVPFGARHLSIVPSDDHTTWRFSYAVQQVVDPDNLSGPSFQSHPSWSYVQPQRRGVIERHYTKDNDDGISREAQKHVSFSGTPEFRSQDLMVTESAQPTYDGYIYDRTEEHLESGDLAIIRMHTMLLASAKALDERGTRPPGVGDYDFRSIRSTDKVLAPEEDWRVLGTNDDPTVQKSLIALGQLEPVPGS